MEIFSLPHLAEHAARLAEAHAAAHPAGPLVRSSTSSGGPATTCWAPYAVNRVRRTGTAGPRPRRRVAARQLPRRPGAVSRDRRGSSSRLPGPAAATGGGTLGGLPTGPCVALDLIAHTDARLDRENLLHYVRSYQAVAPLTIGELWAVPIMLRLGLVENLRGRRGRRSRTGRAGPRGSLGRASVRECARAGLRRGGRPRRARHRRSDVDRRFRGRAPQARPRRRPAMGPVFAWIEDRLVEAGSSAEEVTRRERHRQATNQVSVGNSITSMRLIGTLDWADFFEHVSLVERELRRRPGRCVCRDGAVDPRRLSPTRRAAGRAQRHRRASRWPGGRCRARRLSPATTWPPSGAGTSATTWSTMAGSRWRPSSATARRSASGSAAPSWRTRRRYTSGRSASWPLLAIAGPILAGTDAAMSTLAARVVGPPARPAGQRGRGEPGQPRRDGVLRRASCPSSSSSRASPTPCRTLVVVPTLLTSPDGVRKLAGRSGDPLSRQPGPEPSLRAADRLPRRATARSCRGRRAAGAGPARDRGAQSRHAAGRGGSLLPVPSPPPLEPRAGRLDGLGAQARQAGGVQPPAARRRARPASPAGRRSATLSRTSATSSRSTPTRSCRATWRGAWSARIAHPLNRAVFDPAPRRVVEGYGVIQPRVSITLVSAGRSLLRAPLHRQHRPRPVHDGRLGRLSGSLRRGQLLRQGHLRCRRLRGRAGRTGPRESPAQPRPVRGPLRRAPAWPPTSSCSTTIPSHYAVYARRQHRWVRGDWQLLPWLLPRGADRGRSASRTTSASAAGSSSTTCGGACWRRPSGVARWRGGRSCRARLALDGRRAVRLRLPDLARTSPRRCCEPTRRAGRATCGGSGATCGQPAAGAAQHHLPARPGAADAGRDRPDAHAAVVTRRNLLEWETAAEAERDRAAAEAVDALAADVGPAALALIVLALVVAVRPSASRWRCRSSPLWLLAPVLAAWISRPLRRRRRRAADRRRAPAARRAQDLALLRDVRRPRTTTGCRRTTTRRTRGGARPPHLADEHRPVSALGPRRARLRLRRP